jgi:hypothetical protein
MAPTVAGRLCFFVLASLFAGHSEEALRHCTAIETGGSVLSHKRATALRSSDRI